MHGPYNERFTARRTSTSRRLPRVLVPRHGKRIPQPSQSGKIRQCFQWSLKKEDAYLCQNLEFWMSLIKC